MPLKNSNNLLNQKYTDAMLSDRKPNINTRMFVINNKQSSNSGSDFSGRACESSNSSLGQNKSFDEKNS